jgi:hypothetical protein
VIIVNLNLIRSNKLNVTNVHADRVGAQAAAGIVTGVEDRVTGQISVTHVFRDADRVKIK